SGTPAAGASSASRSSPRRRRPPANPSASSGAVRPRSGSRAGGIAFDRAHSSPLPKKPKPMNKAELVSEVHRQLGDGTSRAAAERAADSVLGAIKKGLKRDAHVHLVGFGTFAV